MRCLPDLLAMNRSLRWPALGLGLAAVAGVVWFQTQTTKRPAARFETTAIDKGRIIARVTATGTVNALVTVLVSSQVSGRVQDVLVDYNAIVKKGQLLARIDPAFFSAAVEQAKANLIAASANAERAKVQALDASKQAERSATLFEKHLIAEAERDTARTTAQAAQAAVTAAEAAIGQARAALNQANVNMAYTEIVSPVGGVVISRAVEPGQTVAASLQAPTLFSIAEDLRKMQVEASVAESDVGRIKEGMQASFVVDAFPQRRFIGTVRQVRNAPITQQGVVTYTTVVDIANEDLALRPGMTANVTFVHAERDDVLRVPNAAFRFRPSNEGAKPEAAGSRRATRGEDNKRALYIERAGQPIRIEVAAGISDGSFTEVSGDIKEGDAVIIDALERASSGAPSASPFGGGSPGGGRRMF